MREAPCSSFRPGKVVAPPLFGLSYTFDYFYLTSCGVGMSETLWNSAKTSPPKVLLNSTLQDCSPPCLWNSLVLCFCFGTCLSALNVWLSVAFSVHVHVCMPFYFIHALFWCTLVQLVSVRMQYNETVCAILNEPKAYCLSVCIHVAAFKLLKAITLTHTCNMFIMKNKKGTLWGNQ